MSKPQSKTLTPEMVDKIKLWRDAQVGLSVMKQKEAKLRNELAALFDFQDDEGTKTFLCHYVADDDVPYEFRLRHTKKLNRNVDKDTPIPRDLKAFFKISYSLKLTDYKKAPEEDKKRLEKLFTEKPGTPTLEIVK